MQRNKHCHSEDCTFLALGGEGRSLEQQKENENKLIVGSEKNGFYEMGLNLKD